MIYVIKFIYQWVLPPACFVVLLVWLAWRLTRKSKGLSAAAGLLVNARHLPFGIAVKDLVGRKHVSWLGCHIMNDESVVFGISQPSHEKRKMAYWLCGLGIALFDAIESTDPTALVGLPLIAVSRMLREAGFELP